MHVLNLSKAVRDRYVDSGALAIDASGREVLLGLTAEESAYVVECGTQPSHALSATERRKLASLVARHERARLHSLSVAGDRGKNEARQG